MKQKNAIKSYKEDVEKGQGECNDKWLKVNVYNSSKGKDQWT